MKRAHRKPPWLVKLLAVFAMSYSIVFSDASDLNVAPGLLARASDSRIEITFAARTPNFTLRDNESVHPQLEPNFRVQWNGFLKVPRTGFYSIHADANIAISGKDVHGRRVRLEAGELPLRIDYQRPSGMARLQLQWESEFFMLEPIPASAFSHIASPNVTAAIEMMERGRSLVESFNCAACHDSGSIALQPAQVSNLSGAVARANPRWLFHWLDNPRRFRNSATMPAQLRSLRDCADVVAYLSSISVATPVEPPTGDMDIAKGHSLFLGVGCAACHDEENISLEGLGSKMTVMQAAVFLLKEHSPGFDLGKDQARNLAEYLTQNRNPEFEGEIPVGDPIRGERLVASNGCLQCHSLLEKTAPERKGGRAIAMARLHPGQGCLAEDVPATAPNYHLALGEREAMNAFLRRPDVSVAPVQDFARVLRRSRCDACHAYDKPARLELSAGQLPPPLTDAGNKLRQSWLTKVFGERKRIRPWLGLQMPHFDFGITGPLATMFAAQAGTAFGDGATLPAPSLSRISQGIALIGRGEGGLSCIGCHDFRGEHAVGDMRGPDMMEMHDRIRTDWLKSWLREPSRYVEGTAMPAFFEGVTIADREEKISRIVDALSVGTTMPTPEGLGGDGSSYLLHVTDQPVVFRGFVRKSSPRSIAVGLPGLLSYCFDADACVLRSAWAGAFLSAKPVWHGRGGQPAQVLGEKFFVESELQPLRIGERTSEPVRKFLGYRLRNGAPEFSFKLNGTQIREFIFADDENEALICVFEVEDANQAVWFKSKSNVNVLVGSIPLAPDEEGWCEIPRGDPRRFRVIIRLPSDSSVSNQVGFVSPGYPLINLGR